MISVLFEDEFIIAVNKPSGIPSHSLKTDDENSVERKLLKQVNSPELFLLHRLDTGTSGVLLFAKNKLVFDEMRNKFKLHEIEKKYLAYTHRSKLTDPRPQTAKLPSFPFRIETPLAHHPKSKKRMIVLPPDLHRVYRGKPIPAITILKSAQTADFEGLPALQFEVEIITGVMHQIRVHLGSVGFPLIGDAIYGKAELLEGSPLPRLGLHALEVNFELRGLRYQVAAPRF